LVSIPALVAAPAAFFLLLVTKQITKMLGVYPVTQLYRAPLMSTGLTFGTISALYGLSHQVIDQAQYSFLVATVIGSAVVPTLIANAFFLPRHLLAKPSAGSTPPLGQQPATSSAKFYPASESN
jgi:glutathione-regulated potassium-efflux system ancillary protein KefC